MDLCADCGKRHQQPDLVRAGHPVCNPCFQKELKEAEPEEATQMLEHYAAVNEQFEAEKAYDKKKKRDLAMLRNEEKEVPESRVVFKKPCITKPSVSLIMANPMLDDLFRDRDDSDDDIDHIKKCAKAALADPKQTVFKKHINDLRNRKFSQKVDSSFISAFALRVGVVGFNIRLCKDVFDQITSINPNSIDDDNESNGESDAMGADESQYGEESAPSSPESSESSEASSVLAPRPKFDDEGYDIAGFDAKGFDRSGYGRDGFDLYGFGRDGFSREGRDIEGYGRDGFNDGGFDRAGNVAAIDVPQQFGDAPAVCSGV